MMVYKDWDELETKLALSERNQNALDVEYRMGQALSVGLGIQEQRGKSIHIKTRGLMLYTTEGGGWLRLFRVGFGWKDTTKHPLTFSERNGYKRHLMIGKWSFGWLAYA